MRVIPELNAAFITVVRFCRARRFFIYIFLWDGATRTVFALISTLECIFAEPLTRPLVCFFFFHLDLIETTGCSQTRSCPRTTFAGRRLTEQLTRTLMKSDEMFKNTVSCHFIMRVTRICIFLSVADQSEPFSCSRRSV